MTKVAAGHELDLKMQHGYTCALKVSIPRSIGDRFWRGEGWVWEGKEGVEFDVCMWGAQPMHVAQYHATQRAFDIIHNIRLGLRGTMVIGKPQLQAPTRRIEIQCPVYKIAEKLYRLWRENTCEFTPGSSKQFWLSSSRELQSLQTPQISSLFGYYQVSLLVVG